MEKNVKQAKLTFGQIIIGIVVLVFAVGLVFNYLSLNEVSAKLNDANKEHEKLVSHSEALNYEVEKQVNFSNIDEVADELGMVKLQSYQIQHINIEESDSMSATLANEQAKNNTIVDNIVASFNIIVEYLK